VLLEADHQLVVVTLAPDSPWPGAKGSSQPVLRTDANGRVEKIIGWRMPVEGLASGRAGETVVTAIVPFCAGPLDDVSPDGSRYALAEVDVAASRGSYRLSLMLTDGKVVWSSTFSYQPVPIPARAVDSVLEQRTSRLPPNQVAAWKTIRFPQHFPPLSRVLAGRDNTTWIETYALDSVRRWTMIDGTGRVAGELAVPREVRLMTVSRSTVWAVETDDDGLQHVVRFRVNR
jgi:hypothetical protein